MVPERGFDNFDGIEVGRAQHARRAGYRDVTGQPPTHSLRNAWVNYRFPETTG